MTRRPPSLRRLAILLTLPVLLVAGMGVWVIRAERARVENEWRAEAERVRDVMLAELPAKVQPRVTGRDGFLADRLAEAGYMIPLWVLNGSGPPPVGSRWKGYELAHELNRAGRRKEALHFLEVTGDSGCADELSPEGTPMMPLVYHLQMELTESKPAYDAWRVVRETVSYPSLLTGRLVESAVVHLPESERAEWKAKAARAEQVYADVEAIGKQRGSGGLFSSVIESGADDRVQGQWTSAGLMLIYKRPFAQVIPEEEISAILKHYGRSGFAEGGMKLTTQISWYGRPINPVTGVEMAAGTKDEWRVSVLSISPESVAAAARRKTFSWGWKLFYVLFLTSVAMAAVYRAFKKQAELARMQTEFVASVSHELRTPVAGIGALAERLESGKADAAQTEEYHRMIAREGRRLAALVDNVLDFSRIERGAKAYDFEHTDLPRLVRETCALLRPHAEEKGLSLVEEIAEVPEDRWPLVDAVALRQALVNLVDNAIKFTPAGGTVTVGMSDGADSSDKSDQSRGVQISVKDTGIGIPAAEHVRIFERFHRVDNGLRRETTGAGIGLSIVKHIAEAHGARVKVESEAEKGSVFTLHFPPAPNHKS